MNDRLPRLAFAKKVAWFAVIGGVGGLVTFVIFVIKRDIYESTVFLWPVLSVAGLVVGALSLRRFYRDEPENFDGFWQLSLVDLLIAMFFAVILMSCYQGLFAESFATTGVIIVPLMTFGFVLCELIATRRGFVRPHLKMLRALGMLLLTLGAMAVGTILVISAVLVFSHERVTQFIAIILIPDNDRTVSENAMWIFISLRVGLLALVPGWCMGRIAEKLNERNEREVPR